MNADPVGRPDPRGPEELAAGAALDEKFAEARRQVEARAFWRRVDERRSRSPADAFGTVLVAASQAAAAFDALGQAFGRAAVGAAHARQVEALGPAEPRLASQNPPCGARTIGPVGKAADIGNRRTRR